jgi:hypothetical protein
MPLPWGTKKTLGISYANIGLRRLRTRFLIDENTVWQSHGRAQRDAVDVLKRFFVEIGDDVDEFSINVDGADDAESEARDDDVGGSEDV